MKSTLLCITCLVASVLAHAQVRKCTAPDGKVIYSDVLCPAATASERKVDHRGNTVDGSALREQAQRDQAAAVQAEAQESARSAAYVAQQKARAQAEETARQEKQADENAYANCARDVERKPGSPAAKTELIAACRTAGAAQRQSGVTQRAVSDCIRNAERVGGSSVARNIAICHGGNVGPEPVIQKQAVLMSCDNSGCWDDAKRWYMRSGSFLYRDDGKACHQVGNFLHCQ